MICSSSAGDAALAWMGTSSETKQDRPMARPWIARIIYFTSTMLPIFHERSKNALVGEYQRK
jgi:hypothetical protein